MSDDKQQQSEALRIKGNEEFKAQKYLPAIEFYTQAIDLFPTLSLYLNRSMACLKVGYSGEALSDADEALKIEPGTPKAYYRKGLAYVQLNKLKDAIRELSVVAQMMPDDPDTKERLAAVQKEHQRQQFLKAIQSEDSVPPSQRIKIDGLAAVSADYDGPRIPSMVAPGAPATTADNIALTQEYVDSVAARFKEEKLIPLRDAAAILVRAIQLLSESPNVVPISFSAEEHIHVCGDTHGQYHDTLHIFELKGKPSKTNRYLFNGDYVDRGSYGVENILLLLAYKVLYPQHFFLSRGNHESRNLNIMYGYEGEVRAKYNDVIFDLMQETWQALPLAHVLNEKVFVVHGGLFSSDEVMVADLNKIDRHRDIPDGGPMCEMLWSDPMVMDGRAKSKRGTGLDFGPDVTRKFLERNKMDLVVRSHEVQPEGYKWMHNEKLVVIFSAANYCGQVGNKGAVLTFKNGSSRPEMTTFTSATPANAKPPMAYAPRGLMGGF